MPEVPGTECDGMVCVGGTIPELLVFPTRNPGDAQKDEGDDFLGETEEQVRRGGEKSSRLQEHKAPGLLRSWVYGEIYTWACTEVLAQWGPWLGPWLRSGGC